MPSDPNLPLDFDVPEFEGSDPHPADQATETTITLNCAVVIGGEERAAETTHRVATAQADFLVARGAARYGQDSRVVFCGGCMDRRVIPSEPPGGPDEPCPLCVTVGDLTGDTLEPTRVIVLAELLMNGGDGEEIRLEPGIHTVSRMLAQRIVQRGWGRWPEAGEFGS